MRCDVNISLRPFGEEKFGTKTEIKNLNSISNVQKALEYEVERQAEILDAGQEVKYPRTAPRPEYHGLLAPGREPPFPS